MNQKAKKVFCAIVIGLSAVSGGRGTSAQAGELSENISVKGDLRYRHELIDQDGKVQRNRQRIRARFGIAADIGSDVKLSFFLASGSGDPVSTNQSLDGGFSSKQINLDIASFHWTPEKVSGLSVTGGKSKVPFYKPGKAELIWDSDLRPEGISANFKHKSGAASFYITAAGFWVNEESSAVDAGLRAVQARVKVASANGKTSVIGGAGYFDYSNLQGRATIYKAAKGFGNTLDGSGNYMYDFNILEVFAEVATKTKTMAVKAFFDYANNTDPSDNNTAWLVGFTVGKNSKKTGSWSARYNYRKIESDAVLGVFTNSDFGGGGTDGQGHEMGLKVQVGKKIQAAATYFINTVDLSTTTKYKRLQLDAIFKI